MQITSTITELRAQLKDASLTALVPTMGNLHAGHIALVREAKALAEQRSRTLQLKGQPKVVVSIFVNRLQFGPGEDYERYPRTFEADCAQLREAGADIVFAPDETVLYPEPQVYAVEPDPKIANVLEGEFRPGHFRGVCTVVLKLFACVEPDIAFFGKKDYQQLMVLTRMVQQFALRVEPMGLSTVRADDGLALSSRNGYLSEKERAEAPRLHRTLNELRNAYHAGHHQLDALENVAKETLKLNGWKPDYISVRKQNDLQVPSAAEVASGEPLVVVAAAKLGATRLIDNIEL
jgi:pantoate--beta-alanine ligase